MKIYTRLGDNKETYLINSIKVDKDDIRLEVYGSLDELNSYIGLSAHYVCDEDKSNLVHIQKTLFNICCESLSIDYEKCKIIVKSEDVHCLENLIDEYTNKIDEINAFIIPGSSKASANLHIARTICRRCERRIVTLSKTQKVNDELLKYINRLSDFLYIIARYYEKELILMN